MQEIGNAFFANADASGAIYEATVVSYSGRLWLVATWQQLTPEAGRVPQWLMPLDALHLQCPEPSVATWVGTGVPKELAGPNAELAAMQRAGAVLNPALAGSPTPPALH